VHVLKPLNGTEVTLPVELEPQENAGLLEFEAPDDTPTTVLSQGPLVVDELMLEVPDVEDAGVAVFVAPPPAPPLLEVQGAHDVGSAVTHVVVPSPTAVPAPALPVLEMPKCDSDEAFAASVGPPPAPSPLELHVLDDVGQTAVVVVATGRVKLMLASGVHATATQPRAAMRGASPPPVAEVLSGIRGDMVPRSVVTREPSARHPAKVFRCTTRRL
jgi:hypothetical protein